MPSVALVDLLQSRLTEIREFIALRPEGHDVTATARRMAINRAAVVLLCAHFEGYVEELVTEALDLLNGAEPLTERVPVRLLATQVDREISGIAGMSDTQKRSERIRRLFHVHGGLWSDERLCRTLDATIITATMGNPGPKQVERLFGEIGMDAVLGGIRLGDGAPAGVRLRELVDVRNAVAHGEDERVMDDQVERYLEAIESLGSELEEAVARHLWAITDSKTVPWT